jgi:hypothetical protein
MVLGAAVAPVTAPVGDRPDRGGSGAIETLSVCVVGMFSDRPRNALSKAVRASAFLMRASECFMSARAEASWYLGLQSRIKTSSDTKASMSAAKSAVWLAKAITAVIFPLLRGQCDELPCQRKCHLTNGGNISHCGKIDQVYVNYIDVISQVKKPMIEKGNSAEGRMPNI